MPNVGDQAPDFAARGSRGDEVRLRDFAGKQHVVLFFYPKDMTSG
jgi:thioredoxin-dependent peroxiredoxin